MLCVDVYLIREKTLCTQPDGGSCFRRCVSCGQFHMGRRLILVHMPVVSSAQVKVFWDCLTSCARRICLALIWLLRKVGDTLFSITIYVVILPEHPSGQAHLPK